MALRSHIYQKQAKNSVAAIGKDSLQSRPFAPPAQIDPSQTLADLQAQVEHARRYGHSLAKINLSPSPSALPWIQPKLTIGAPGDKYEREADRVAQQVVHQLNAPQGPKSEQSVRRETLPEEEELQMKPLADRIQRGSMPEEEEELQMKPDVLQRETLPEDDELQMKSMVQRSPTGTLPASEKLEHAIAQARGRGQPLADPIRQPMEQAFGADFSRVRIHADTQSDRLNRSIQARAFTTGQDVFFRQGAYQPGNRGGQELLAHELTHVVQQGAVRTQRIQAASETLSPEPIGVLQDLEKPIRRHSDKNLLNDQIKTWKSPIAQTLMTGVLDRSDASAAAGQVYDNMFTYVPTFGWQYKAGCSSSNGANLIEGKSQVGMCETYRNAFKYMLEQYFIPLVADYDPFAGGLTVKEGQALVMTKFVTSEGLALLGRSEGYNVEREVNAKTGAEKETKRYLFSSHWQLEVNGTTYDPLFKGDGTGNIAWELVPYGALSGALTVDGGEDIVFVEDPSQGPTPGGEFMGRYGLVRDISAFESSMKQKAKTQNAVAQLESVRSKLASAKLEWDTVCTWWYGKDGWRIPIQTTSIPEWISKLEEVRTNARPDIPSMAKDPLLDRLVATSRKNQYGEKIAYQAGIAKRALERLKEQTETMEMGEDFEKALEAVNKAKAEAQKDEG
ncbi:DUF4157 domain-containing protein [Altericista sp. CCNU0014]|uniref:eCIS core domain-containing protein n=1 Tax=Altericista sp. CCNU0014 TaxID=3082949 RepID=UPI00384B902B